MERSRESREVLESCQGIVRVKYGEEGAGEHDWFNCI